MDKITVYVIFVIMVTVLVLFMSDANAKTKTYKGFGITATVYDNGTKIKTGWLGLPTVTKKSLNAKKKQLNKVAKRAMNFVKDPFNNCHHNANRNHNRKKGYIVKARWPWEKGKLIEVNPK